MAKKEQKESYKDTVERVVGGGAEAKAARKATAAPEPTEEPTEEPESTESPADA